MRTEPSRQDERVKARHFSWKFYIGTLVALSVLSALPAVLYGAPVLKESRPFVGWYLLYWAIVTGLFCGFTAYQKHRAYDRPMRKLSEAAKRVAEGDFSVYVAPGHRADKLDYVDVMFQDFNKMVEELGSLETMKSDFIASVSHEIKTPLSVIQSYSTALQSEALPPETRREYTQTIVASSQKLASLVTNILKLNKIENQVIPLNSEPYDLCRQLCECALAFEGAWENKQIEFAAELDDRLIIRADESLLEIVWNNLLSNAVKFTNPGGKIQLRQTSDENSVTVSVTDTGCGMDEHTRRHVFDKFYQGDTSHYQEGNGLGLALAWKAVELEGGSISVDSAPGEGTTFTVRLPLRLD
ncbi:HAMP domain-containing sensor histidine kinase [Paenibacillus sp. YN15]|uniref:sensor histidine kinase n=1 Tax=Paenibacillus sp. YN15 TaxID=1742774 RepID=UPI000DCE72E8|nr:HAMP domain-containing sensor histidine kinase [Paenibacillus sp. YN15]RAU93314.1 sensor histidine kinase [Paenibacillus sp. YN15]